MKSRSSHWPVLLRAGGIAGLALFVIIGGTVWRHRQLRDTERQRAVTEARQLAFGISRQSAENFWRVREEFIFSLTSLPYERLLQEDEPIPETLVPIRRFLSLNQSLIRELVVTGPDGTSRSASLSASGYFSLSPRTQSGLPSPSADTVTLSGIVQGRKGEILASVTAVVDPVRFWQENLTSFSLSHPSLWIHLLDTDGRPVITRQGRNVVSSVPVFPETIRQRFQTDARDGFEGRLFQDASRDGATLHLISAYVPVKIEEWRGLLMVSADEAIVLGAAGDTLRLLATGAAILLLLVLLSFALFIRHTLRNQAQLEDGRRRIETVLNTVQSGIILVHARTGHITEVNAAAIALLGGGPGDILGHTIDTLLPAARNSFIESTPVGTSFEARLPTRAGTERHVLAATAPLNLAGSLHTLCSFVDITALKETESRLHDAVARAEAANRAKSAFLAMMSHELRTPLNSILSLSESVIERVHGPLNEKQERYLKIVRDSGRDLLGLINDILDLAKIDSDPEPLSLTVCSVRTLCEAGLFPSRVVASRRNQIIETVLPAPTVSIRADARRFQQTLGNLLTNASKFTATGGQIGLQVETTETEVSICVWDRGIGIAKANLDRIFDPFVQLDARLSREYQGTGLGLTIVKRIVNLHGGNITVQSTPGEGSRFTITLPRIA